MTTIMNSTADDVCTSFQVLKEMLLTRKQFDKTYCDVEQSLNSLSNNELQILASKSTFAIDVSNSVKIIYFLAPKFVGKNVNLSVLDGNDEIPKVIIFVVKEKFTPTNEHNLETAIKTRNPNASLQIFDIKQLLFNISKHALVPKHEVVPEEEIPNLLNQYSLKSKTQLPAILKTDPMAKFLGIKPGQILKITRVSPSAGEYSNFRCCT